MRMMSIASGSSGNCIYIGSDAGHFLIDAGVSGKKIEEGLRTVDINPRELSGICVSHEHIDHVAGLGVMARRYDLPLYMTKGTWHAIKSMKQVGEIPDYLFREIKAEENFKIADMEVKPISVSHDAEEPVAYITACNGKTVGVMTDLGYYTERQMELMQGLSLLLLESNHDPRMLETGPYPYYLKRRIAGDMGHLSNESAGQFLSGILHDNFKGVMLGHLSKENNLPELAYETVRTEITMADVEYKGDDFPIYVAKRDMPSIVLEA